MPRVTYIHVYVRMRARASAAARIRGMQRRPPAGALLKYSYQSQAAGFRAMGFREIEALVSERGACATATNVRLTAQIELLLSSVMGAYTVDRTYSRNCVRRYMYMIVGWPARVTRRFRPFRSQFMKS